MRDHLSPPHKKPRVNEHTRLYALFYLLDFDYRALCCRARKSAPLTVVVAKVC